MTPLDVLTYFMLLIVSNIFLQPILNKIGSYPRALFVMWVVPMGLQMGAMFGIWQGLGYIPVSHNLFLGLFLVLAFFVIAPLAAGTTGAMVGVPFSRRLVRWLYPQLTDDEFGRAVKNSFPGRPLKPKH